jgi:hypothetical protein
VGKALDELLGNSHPNPNAAAPLRHIFEGQAGPVADKTQATNRAAEVLSRAQLSLVRNGTYFQVVPRSVDSPAGEAAAQTRADFVDSVWSVTRRLSVLDQMGPHTARSLDGQQLREYLRNSGKVRDYEQVADSFKPSLKAEVITFQQPTTLLRLYGGTSGANGRYYFCCMRKAAQTLGLASPWVDASGLATPPDNLLNHLAAVSVPAGTTAIVGTVSDNFLDELGNAERGGNTQIFIPELTTFPFTEYRIGNGGNPVTEIAVRTEDRTLRFRGASQ